MITQAFFVCIVDKFSYFLYSIQGEFLLNERLIYELDFK